ncbi:MAG: FAD-binding oxidoreductase, partial [Caulobacteraceae bacterium]|nr:FAD-binding oxidoreductase [Caulobacteraceae bacterium]
ARLRALGFDVHQHADRVEAPGDVRVAPAEALAAMIARLPRPVLSARALDGRATDQGWSLTTTAGPVTARQVILATGAAAALPGLPPAVAALIDAIEPIAGQIGRALHPPGPEGVRRGPDGYVVAARDHWLIGATMVAGSRDPTPDPDQSRRLEAVAERLLDRPLDGPVSWTGGIRGSTPDGLPLAGPAAAPGLHLALAPRRNGWLLGPLVGRIVADGIEGRPPVARATALDPLRFSPPAG